MVSSILLLSAYVAMCSPTLTFGIVKGTCKLTKYISDGLMKRYR